VQVSGSEKSSAAVGPADLRGQLAVSTMGQNDGP